MRSSQRSGELQLISEMVAGVRSIVSRPPKRISVMASVSCGVHAGDDVAHVDLVGERLQREGHVEMPRVQRRVLRLADDPARRVEHGEALGEAGEVAEVVHRGVAAHLALAHERRPVDGAERHGVVADVHAVRGVAGLHVERPGRLGDLLEHEVGVEPDDALVVLDLLPGLAEQLQRPRVAELDPDLRDQPAPARRRGWSWRRRKGSRSGAFRCGTCGSPLVTSSARAALAGS